MPRAVGDPAWRETLDRDGAIRCPAALDEATCGQIEAALGHLPEDRAGVRLRDMASLTPLITAGSRIGGLALTTLGAAARPVRALLFDKSPAANWALGWHQDRTIVVERRADAPAFGPWTVKAGLIQVEPPFAIIEAMLTIRVHLDPVDATNAPLAVIPGSHRLGRLASDGLDRLAETDGQQLCLAERGDVWVYRTAIVHGSAAADPPRRRRVLQIDYAVADLPPPLCWRGV
jgi:hypothetical protein